MSALLLDTHIWLWYAEGVSERLKPASVRKLDEARQRDGLVISAISVWEIGMHSARGRIQLAVPLRDWVEKALASSRHSLRATRCCSRRRKHAAAG
jgi:PIN domain nuclease of toxin-antitoxin system